MNATCPASSPSRPWLLARSSLRVARRAGGLAMSGGHRLGSRLGASGILLVAALAAAGGNIALWTLLERQNDMFASNVQSVVEATSLTVSIGAAADELAMALDHAAPGVIPEVRVRQPRVGPTRTSVATRTGMVDLPAEVELVRLDPAFAEFRIRTSSESCSKVLTKDMGAAIGRRLSYRHEASGTPGRLSPMPLSPGASDAACSHPAKDGKEPHSILSMTFVVGR